MQPVLFYCFDAYCGWCYGFSPVMTKLTTAFPDLQTEVLSGGMILPDNPVPISATAHYIEKAYPEVERLTGIKFGQDYLWHIKNPELSDWFPHSEKPAIALCIFKTFYPEKQVAFAAELQYALHFEGRDLTDDEAYRHLLEKYSIQPELFYENLHSETFKEQAHYEFALVKQLQVTGYPAVLIQISASKFHLVASGYTDYETLSERVRTVLATTNPSTQ